MEAGGGEVGGGRRQGLGENWDPVDFSLRLFLSVTSCWCFCSKLPGECSFRGQGAAGVAQG